MVITPRETHTEMDCPRIELGTIDERAVPLDGGAIDLLRAKGATTGGKEAILEKGIEGEIDEVEAVRDMNAEIEVALRIDLVEMAAETGVIREIEREMKGPGGEIVVMKERVAEKMILQS